MKCLIDADVLLHELGWSGQFRDKDSGEDILLSFDKVVEMLEEKIRIIEYDCYADEPSEMFISPSEKIVEMWNKHVKYTEGKPIEFVPNFRYEVGVTKPYKGTRNNPKPVHFYNIVAYLMFHYDMHISKDGLEADDELCIAQRFHNKNGRETTICSRDKDLRICPGLHYSWECGKQPSIGPVETDVDGWLEQRWSQKTMKRKDGTTYIKEEFDVIGYGLSFFFYQMLVGDAADNIPGLPKIGKAGAWDLLNNKTVGDMKTTVKDLYKERMGSEAKTYFIEQANLLWMRQERLTPFDVRRL